MPISVTLARTGKGNNLLTTARRAATALAAGTLLLLGGAAAPVPLALPAVAKGEIQNVKSPVDVTDFRIGNKNFQVTKMVIQSRPEQIWHVLTDYDNACRVFLNLKDCKILEDRGCTKVVKHRVRPTGLPGTFEYVLEVKETAPRRIEWHRLRGDFRAVDGYWSLDPLEGGKATLVTYCAHIDGGLFLPAPIVRRQIRVDMPIVMDALKAEVENKLQIARGPEGSRGQ